MGFLNPAGLWLLSLAIPIILLHILRPRREATPVASTYLWESMEEPVAAATPWQKLKPNLLLFLQLLAVLLFTLVVAHPVLRSPSPLARHTVFIVDASGSMAAVDGSPDRLEDAKREARKLRDQLPPGGRASIVVADQDPQIALTASSDKSLFSDALKPIETIAARADFASAFGLAEALADRDGDTGYVLLSDGGLTPEEEALLPPGTRYESIGDQATNRAIVRLTVESDEEGTRALAVVQNTGGARVSQDLRVDVDGVTIETIELNLDPGEIVEEEVALPTGERVTAFLDGEDLIAVDNRAFALAPRREPVRIKHIGPENPFLTALFSKMEEVEIERAQFSEPAEGFDLAIYDRVPIPEDPGAPVLAISPVGGLGDDVVVTGEAELPVLTLVRGEDPLLVDLDFSEVAIAQSQIITAPPNGVLLASEDTPLLVRGSVAGHPYIYLGFALEDSNLGLQVAFPRLGGRFLDQLTGEFDPSAQLRVGERLPVRGGPGVSVVGPGEVRTEVSISSLAPVADRPGYWRIEDNEELVGLIAVNPDPAESAVGPAETLTAPPPPPGAVALRPDAERSIRPWFILGLLAILVAEFLVSRRQVGVPQWQRKTAAAGRILAAGLLVLALIGVPISRPADDVATVFLLDASDSLGPTGREAAADFVRQAIDTRPGSASSAVVVFGNDARVELPLGTDELGRPRVVVDATQTDLAGALRLAGAVMPANSRRRVVLVSDGRPTKGDAATEAKSLAARGIQVDVHTINAGDSIDAAVSSVNAPDRAREGEEVEIVAAIDSNAVGPATVTLRREGEVLERISVDLDAGRNEVVFTDTADETGLARYQVEVDINGDGVEENNTAFTAVQQADSARVLLVEGITGDGEVLANALSAAGVVVDTIGPGEIPPLDELATYATTVLVDVDARLLSPTAVENLTTATRDLGKGLVTTGGPRSFGPGGYLDTELEELLPVISEVTDPQRRKSVAQVLAIDTSESMGACHCAEDNNGLLGENMLDGGVNKTDISRAAARRAIEVMADSDEIGVLAFDDRARWVIDLQQNPSDDLVDRGLTSLRPAGGTQLRESLTKSAEALRASDASIKHIVLFTDGFTEPFAMDGVAEQAASLFAEGITVSVVGTGEGVPDDLEEIAAAGGGRFYPGRDLEAVPEIIVQETFVASRNFINEGDFLPEITSIAAPVRDLDEAPTLTGFIATTAKDEATTSMRIGEERDPLLASWQVGLGRSTAWTSDATARWSDNWSRWDGFVNFWSTLVKDTFPVSEGAVVDARAADGKVAIAIEGEDSFPAGSTATARVTGPDGVTTEVILDRVDGSTFEGVSDAGVPGSYAAGVTVTDVEGNVIAGASSLASQSYSIEYQPGRSDRELLNSISEAGGGRGEIEAAQSFDAADLPRGSRAWQLAPWFLAFAILAWLLSAMLSRLALVKPSGSEDKSWREVAKDSRAERKERKAAARRMEPGWVRTPPPGRQAGGPDFGRQPANWNPAQPGQWSGPQWAQPPTYNTPQQGQGGQRPAPPPPQAPRFTQPPPPQGRSSSQPPPPQQGRGTADSPNRPPPPTAQPNQPPPQAPPTGSPPPPS